MTWFTDPNFRYDLFVVLAALGMLAIIWRFRSRFLSTNSPNRHGLALLLHVLVITGVLLCHTGMVLSLKKGGDSVCTAQTAFNVGRADFSQYLGQHDVAEGYHVPVANLSIFSRGFSIMPWLYMCVYYLAGSALGFIWLQGAVEILVIYGSGWLLYREFAARQNDGFASFLFLFAYDICFVHGYFSFKDVDYFTYSLLGLTLFWRALWHNRLTAAAIYFIGVMLLRDIFLPVLGGIMLLAAWHRRIQWRLVFLFCGGAVIWLFLLYRVAYPLSGISNLMMRSEGSLNPGALLYAAPGFLFCLLAMIALSGGALLLDWRCGIVTLLLACFPFLMGRTLEWWILYAGATRFFWPLPFLALITVAVNRPRLARVAVISACAAGLLLSYAWGPWPFARNNAHAKSPLNCERFTPGFNQPAIVQASLLIPPTAVVEASYSFLQLTADRTLAFPLKYYSFIDNNPLKQRNPPEYIAFDLFAPELLMAKPVELRHFYAYLATRYAAGYRTAFYRDGALLMQLQPEIPLTARDTTVRHDLTAFGQLPPATLHALTVANRYCQPERLRLLLAPYEINAGLPTPQFDAVPTGGV